jgi:Type II secretion system (T2SS), protein K
MGGDYSTWPNAILRDVDLVKKRSLNSKFEIRNSKSISGAALMLALWALFMLSAMVISWALDIQSRLTLSGNANRALSAEAMACSGADIALHPSVSPSSPNLHRQMGSEGYEARIAGEGGRLNLNWLTAGQEPVRLAVLRRYLELKGVDLNDRDTMIDSLLDWVEPNTGLHRLNAPPETDDYRPPHAPLGSVEELKKVFGWKEFTSQPGWDDDFTINSSGPIDLAWASRDVLRALPGARDDLVDRFLQLRQGPDGIDGTADDFPFNNLTDVQTALGFTAEQFQQIAALLVFKDSVFRITSVGRSGNVRRSVQVLVRKAGNVPQLISWKEI